MRNRFRSTRAADFGQTLHMTRWFLVPLIVLLAGVATSSAQTPLPAPRPDGAPRTQAAAGVNLRAPAKQLFGGATDAAPLAARAIGFYTRGCLAGGVALPVNGETWQVMRLSRNRNWGHPDLIAMLERLARTAPQVSSWPGILVGDLAQPRGGPMLTGHASHQVGLDADVWLNPMPRRTLTRDEREKISAVSVVASNWLDVDPAVWTRDHTAIIRAAAQDPAVERVLINPAIKKALCREAGGDRRWLAKVRPWWGHNYHMHIRIGCPAGSAGCRAQEPVGAGDGCDGELDWWFQQITAPKKPETKPARPAPEVTLADMPPACRDVLTAR